MLPFLLSITWWHFFFLSPAIIRFFEVKENDGIEAFWNQLMVSVNLCWTDFHMILRTESGGESIYFRLVNLIDYRLIVNVVGESPYVDYESAVLWASHKQKEYAPLFQVRDFVAYRYFLFPFLFGLDECYYWYSYPLTQLNLLIIVMGLKWRKVFTIFWISCFILNCFLCLFLNVIINCFLVDYWFYYLIFPFSALVSRHFSLYALCKGSVSLLVAQLWWFGIRNWNHTVVSWLL